MIKKYGSIQGQHLIGAGFFATLLGVLFNLASPKVNNYLPQIADMAQGYAASGYADPYGFGSVLANQPFSRNFGDNYGRTASYNDTASAGLGGLFGGNGYTNANYSQSSYGQYGQSNYAQSSYGQPNYALTSYGQSNYAQQPYYTQQASQPSYASTLGTGNRYQNTNSLSNSYGSGSYANPSYPASTVSYGSPTSYSNNGYGNSTAYGASGYGHSSYANNGWGASNYGSTTGYGAAGYGNSNYGSTLNNRTQQYGGSMRAYFSPNGGCTDAIVRELQQAQRMIYIQAYSFTSEPIAMACASALRRGVQVIVVLDKSQMSEQNSAADYLASAGVTTMIDSTHQIAHNKVILIDGRTIITGSFNFTYNAEHNNAENLLVIYDNPELYAAYENNFRRCYSQSSAYAGRTSNRSTFGYR